MSFFSAPSPITTLPVSFLGLSSQYLGSRNFFPIALNKSSIPLELKAEVSLKMAPMELANSLASLSFTCSLSNKSDLLAAIAKTNQWAFNY